MKILGLMETALSFSSNLDVSILCSPYINEWIRDCSKGEDQTHGDNVIYSGKRSVATNLSPNNFVNSLSTLEEDNREEYGEERHSQRDLFQT